MAPLPEDEMNELRAAMAARMGVDPSDNDDADGDDTDEPSAQIPDDDTLDHPDNGEAHRRDADGGAGVEGAEPPGSDPADEPVAEQDPEPADDEDPEPAAEPSDVPDLIEIDGRFFRREDLPALRQLIEFGEQAILNAPSAPNTPAASASAPTAPSAPEPEPFDPQQYIDPDLAAAVDRRFKESIDPLQEKIDLLLQAQQHQDQLAAEARMAELQAANMQALATVQEKFGLSDAELDRLEQIAVEGGFGHRATQIHANDPLAGFTLALEDAYWGTPEYRERTIQQQATDAATAAAEAERERLAATQRATKKQKSTALSGGSSSLPRTTAAPANPSARRAAMVDAIAAITSEN